MGNGICGKSERAAYAKINLTLNVTGKRPDGYHELESVMQTVSLCDDVSVTCKSASGAEDMGGTGGTDGAGNAVRVIRVRVEAHDGSLVVENIPTDERNTAYKAAREYFAYLEHQRCDGGVERRSHDAGRLDGGVERRSHDAGLRDIGPERRSHDAGRLDGGMERRSHDAGLRDCRSVQYELGIHINKRIPIAAGLAGGSADAAAVLLALNDITKAAYDAGECEEKPLSSGELAAVAARVGADVPFCLYGGTAYATGIGDRLRRLPPLLSQYVLVLVNPRFEISTAWVYASFTLPPLVEIKRLSGLARIMIESDDYKWDGCFNVLEQAVLERFPLIARLKAEMREYGAISAVMSGSGPTVYGIFNDHVKAQTAEAGFRANGHWAATCAAVDAI